MTAVLFNKRKLLSLKRTACPEIFDYHQILFYCEECVRIAAQSYEQTQISFGEWGAEKFSFFFTKVKRDRKLPILDRSGKIFR